MPQDTLDTIVAEMTALIKRAYKLGGDARTAQIIAAAGGFNTSGSTILTEEVNKPRERGYRAGTVIADIHDFVKEVPGLTLKEIVQQFQAKYPDVPEKTIRTSLLRLRDKWGGILIEENGKWRSK